MDKLDKIKQFFGLQKYSAYVTEQFDYSNIRSSLHVSAVVIVLELWMIITTFLTQLDNRSTKTELPGALPAFYFLLWQWVLVSISLILIILKANSLLRS